MIVPGIVNISLKEILGEQLVVGKLSVNHCKGYSHFCGETSMVGYKHPTQETLTTHVRVMVVAANEMGALLLREALDRSSGCEVVKSVATCEEALTIASVSPPDLAVIDQDVEGEPLKGLHLTSLLASGFSSIKPVIMVRSRSSPEVIAEAFQSGARGIFHHGQPVDELWQCICDVHRGQIYASQADLSCLVERLVPLRLLNAQGRAILTKREQVIASSVTEGHTNREIAKNLQLSEHTVKNYLFRIFDKLGVSSRAELIFYVLSRRAQASEAEKSSVDSDSKSLSDASALPQNLKRAYEGSASAQYRLGELYDVGQGVPKDRVSSYMWLAIAEETAASLMQSAREARNRIVTRMTSGDIAAAQSRAMTWLNNCGEQANGRKRSARHGDALPRTQNTPPENGADEEVLSKRTAADA